jgi:Ca2+-transporting ATPase
MERKPRNPNEKTISKRMIKSIGTVAVLMCIATLGLFKFVLWQGMGIDMARTVAVATIITLELVRVQAVRAEYNVNLTSNKWLWLALGSSLLLMFAIIYVPVLQTLFHTVALPLSIWTWIIGACLLVFILVLFKQKIEERFKK